MSTPTRRPRLDLTKVVEAAIAIADEQSLDAVSMRNVAERLGVTPMALYKHVAHRSRLVDEMLDDVLGDLRPVQTADDWQDTVRARVLAAREVLMVHPWVRDAIETRDAATPRTLAHMDSLIAAMFDGGLSADLVHHAMHALSTRMWGFTRDVLPTPQIPDDPDERAAAMAEFASTYPAITRMATTSPHPGVACDDDAEFAFALDLILGGVQRLHESGWERATPARTLLETDAAMTTARRTR